jgi:hypothetical protein
MLSGLHVLDFLVQEGLDMEIHSLSNNGFSLASIE